MKSRPLVLSRLAVIIDEDVAIYKACRRIAPEVRFDLLHFYALKEFLGWLENNPPPVKGRQAVTCCLVIDPKLIADKARFIQMTLDMPKIYIGVPGASCELSKLSKLGYFNFIAKPFPIASLQEAIALALSHHERNLLSSFEISSRFNRLTRREYEVGQLVTSGLTNQEICLKLGISIKTVKVHRANLMKKTQAASLADLVRLFDNHRP